MTQRLRILISGDLFMKPEAFRDALVRQLTDEPYELDFRIVEHPYPVEEFPLTNYTSRTQSGGVWDEPKRHPEEQSQNAEVSEYYGGIDEFVGKIADADILLVHSAPITRAVLNDARNLKLIACCRGGPKNVNIEAATERGIPVVNTPGRNAVAVAEFTIGLLLAHTRYIARGHAHLIRGIWKAGVYRDEYVGPQLHKRTVGIVGLGSVGCEMARILGKGFQVRLLVHDPYVAEDSVQSLGAETVSLDTLLRESDFVILSARLTPETTTMITERELTLMKPSAYLVNTARGGLVDYDALLQALQERRIAGAALDVFGEEPPVRDYPLLRMPNVTVTPHIGGAAIDVLYYAADTLAGEVHRFVRGEPLCNCLNPTVLTQKLDDVWSKHAAQ